MLKQINWVQAVVTSIITVALYYAASLASVMLWSTV